MSRKHLAWMLAAAVLVPSLAAAESVQQAVQSADGTVTLGQLVETSATVMAVDVKERKVTLRSERGEDQTIDVSDEVRNLEQVAVGDVVRLEYYEAITVGFEKVDKKATELTESTQGVRAKLGEKPGGVAVHEVTVVAEVVALDAAAGTVTLRGPRGREETLQPKAEALKKLAVGDFVKAVYTEAIAISVEKVKSAG